MSVGTNFVYVLQRGHQLFPTRIYGGGKAIIYDRESRVVVSPAFQVTPWMHFVGMSNNAASVSMTPDSDT